LKVYTGTWLYLMLKITSEARSRGIVREQRLGDHA